MSIYDSIKQKLKESPKVWLVTGVAGFIGSNLLETLLRLNQRVIGLDNFSTGHQRNLDEVRALVSDSQWSRFDFRNEDILDYSACYHACNDVDYVLHQAALGSVTRSIEDPLSTNQSNINGFLTMLVAARDARVKHFVYAASSSTYGDHPALPKVEDQIGRPLSPYAVTKLVNELYAEVFSRIYGVRAIGLRYFNVFGRRQDPGVAYAAVIPKWISAMIRNESVFINGDGETSRDFCYVDNVVQANLLAAIATAESASNKVYNVAFGERTSLNDLYLNLRGVLSSRFPQLKEARPIYQSFRDGDVRHSLADISMARSLLGYNPTHNVSEGLLDAIDWYVQYLK